MWVSPLCTVNGECEIGEGEGGNFCMMGYFLVVWKQRGERVLQVNLECIGEGDE